ncbi:MAG: glutamate--tRNA ligase [Eubacteriales bacterium]
MSNTDTLQKLASLIFPDVTDADTVESLEERFPERGLSEGAKVTRIAPSPTGSMHIGNLYGGLADERIAHSATKDGVFYLRIEDTDDKREVPGAVEKIIKYLGAFGIEFDEGASADGDIGAYGPYRQRARAKIYHIVAKKLLLDGRAYPCFCTEEDLQKAHAAQEAAKENFGYYGKWAIHRDMPAEEAIKRIENGESYVLRFRSMGDPTKKVEFKDQIKGKLSFPENDQDFVLLKSDGIPTYHFAHVVDDHFMRTTDVVRGEEWLSTLPWHVELWRACGFKMPRFCHTAQVMKLDEETGTKRKMSKRKDPECTLGFYFEKGYPAASVIEYLMTLLNSNYEQWRQANPTASYKDFPFKASAMGNSGAMFDLAKFNDVSKNVIAHMTADEVYAFVAEWAKENDPDFYALISADADYLKKFLAIGRGGKKPRKDFACWSEVKEFVSYMYDALFEQKDEYPAHVSTEDRNVLLKEYAALYVPEDDNNTWFEKVKNLSEAHGYTGDMKAYKATPDAFKGSVADVSNVIRVAITGRTNSPDLCSLMALLGKDRVTERLEKAANC